MYLGLFLDITRKKHKPNFLVMRLHQILMQIFHSAATSLIYCNENVHQCDDLVRNIVLIPFYIADPSGSGSKLNKN